jgi:hypothetical protein
VVTAVAAALVLAPRLLLSAAAERRRWAAVASTGALVVLELVRRPRVIYRAPRRGPAAEG